MSNPKMAAHLGAKLAEMDARGVRKGREKGDHGRPPGGRRPRAPLSH